VESVLNFPGEHFSRKGGELHLGAVRLADIANKFGTPLYVYDFDRIRERALNVTKAIKSVTNASRAYFAVKALSNLSVLRLAHQQGMGMDVVSGGEIERCLAAKIPARDIIFSGVAKSRSEIELGARAGIGCFNIESPHEIELLSEVATLTGQKLSIALRVNPDVDGHTHRKINTGPSDTKFGLSPDLARAISRRVLSDNKLNLRGISCHIGSQILDMKTFATAAKEMRVFASELLEMGAPLKHIDMGGGIGIAYKPSECGSVPIFDDWVSVSKGALPRPDMDLYLEPGRSIVGDSGLLLTTVLDIKYGEKKNFVLVDAGMTELVRPAMYDAYHHIEPLVHSENLKLQKYDVVGPVCETSCWLGEDVNLGDVKIGDVLAVLSAGAYGMTMASNYNTRPRPAEVAIENKRVRVIKNQEKLAALWADELTLLGD